MATKPLAEQLRPDTLDSFIGQKHLVGPNAILRKSIESGQIPSMILWGPPGVGKTTLAHIISKQLQTPFFSLSAIHSGVKEVRQVLEQARMLPRRPILFLDEIHRFSKSQQDSLLGAVEKGLVSLIGATTENPSFEVIAPLLSRCQVYVLKNMEKSELEQLLQIGIDFLEAQTNRKIQIQEADPLLGLSGGDARKLFNGLELIVQQKATAQGPINISKADISEVIQEKILQYDKSGEMHYDVISAFIKSVRGSDPQAAVYYLARMVESGEDPKFIARRLLILAAEDIGLANPNALLLANSCFEAVEKIGWPESRIILSQATLYLATSPKSNSAYTAIQSAQQEVKASGSLPVPLAIRNAPTRLMKELNYGKSYKYAHDHPGHFAWMEFLPEGLENNTFYKPAKNKREQEIREKQLEYWKNKYEI